MFHEKIKMNHWKFPHHKIPNKSASSISWIIFWKMFAFFSRKREIIQRQPANCVIYIIFQHISSHRFKTQCHFDIKKWFHAFLSQEKQNFSLIADDCDGNWWDKVINRRVDLSAFTFSYFDLQMMKKNSSQLIKTKWVSVKSIAAQLKSLRSNSLCA